MTPITDALLAHARMPARYRQAKVSSLNDETYLEFIKSYVKSSNTHMAAGKGIWFHGNTGTGKTYTACAIMRALLAKGHSVLYTTPMELRENVLKNVLFSEEDNQTWDDRAKTVNFLCLDDLGAEYAASSGFNEKLIELIILRRYEQLLPTIITTNLSSSDLRIRYGDRFLSRIKEACFEVEMRGNDRRVETYKKENASRIIKND